MAFKNIVDSGQIPGIIAYSDGKPIVWCSVSPRKAYLRLERSRILKRIDGNPVLVNCVFLYKQKNLEIDLSQKYFGFVVKFLP